jgi:histidinol-phosphatase (PHP family)
MFLLDCHNHTEHSYDGHATVKEMCDAANAAQFDLYCMTDHYECQCAAEHGAFLAIGRCLKDAREYAATHPLGTKILCGVEMGQPLQALDEAERLLQGYGDELDFVIGSVHNVAGEPDFHDVDYENTPLHLLDTLCERYYEELYQMTLWGEFDAMGHITYPYRYAAIHGVDLDYRKHDELVERMMRQLVQKGIALEINTSGYRQGVGEPLPGLHHLQMYRRLGGELLTIGSDAHRVTDFAKNIVDGLELAKQAGFTYITYFEQRKPVMVKL